MTADNKYEKKTEVIPRTPIVNSVAQENLSSAEAKGDKNEPQPDQPVIKNVLPSDLDEQYSVLKKIGDGGMGIVYLAQDNKLGRYVAIKRLNKASMSHPSIKQRFFQEAKTVAGLTHSHIVHVYALDEDDNGPFIVMEYIPGPPERSPDSTPPAPFSLVDLIEQDGPMSSVDAIDLMIKIAKTIEYAHRNKVIHRDLKPSNVLLDETSEPKIVDFGLARKSNPNDRKLTVPGERMLSLGYGAPEQEADASTTDERADIYGLGALMYFCITGQNPRYFREGDIPQEIQRPIAKALETHKEKRWATVTEFIDALKHVHAPSTIEIPTVKTTWRCKWCETVNPVTVQYCEDCGWDGVTPCLECGAKMHVGIQHCGECGADAREYEAATRLLSRLKSKMTDKDFAYVAKHAERSPAFRPVGPNGRIIVEDILKLREEAEQIIERTKQLKDFIPMEMSSQNYERARQFINEFRDLTDQLDFSSELSQIPELIARRDIQRASKALSHGDLQTASRLSSAIADTQTAFSTEASKILNKITHYRMIRRIRRTVILILLLVLIYIMSAAPVYRMSSKEGRRTFTSFYNVEMLLHASTFLKNPLEAYARAWGVEHMYKERNLQLVKTTTPVKTNTEISSQVTKMRADYEKEMLKAEIQYERQVNVWPEEYKDALLNIQQRMQIEGDYEGWNAVRDELRYFDVFQEINFETYIEDPQILTDTKVQFKEALDKYKSDMQNQINSVTTGYTQSLTNLQKELTKKGKMEDAETIETELKRVNSDPRVIAAREAVELERQRLQEEKEALTNSTPE